MLLRCCPLRAQASSIPFNKDIFTKDERFLTALRSVRNDGIGRGKARWILVANG